MFALRRLLLLGIFVLFFMLANLVRAENFVHYNAESLAQVKGQLKAGTAHPITQKAYEHLLAKAEQLLKEADYSVMNKTFFPPSKNKHDYLSISRYWWPDPKKKDGLPWIRKDGITNPSTQTDDVDRKRLGKMTSAVKKLSLAYYFSDNETYAAKAISVLHTWFLDKNTRMNPHLQYAQSVPGNPKGRRSGILDGRLIPLKVIDSITILENSVAWSKEYKTGMNAWLRVYLDWLTKSKLGKKGAKQTNNHGSWYHFQIASLAMYLGDTKLANTTFERVKDSFAFQFDGKGAQPHELKRTRSYFYSAFNLDAMTRIATMSEKAGNSIWDYESKDGKSFAKAINFLLPATQGAQWPYKTKGVKPIYLAPTLARISAVMENDKYPQILHKILNEEFTSADVEISEIYLHFALIEPQFL